MSWLQFTAFFTSYMECCCFKPTEWAMSSNSSRLTSCNSLRMAFSFSLILTAFSVISSWVSWLPPNSAKFGPVVMRLWPSESSPTPSRRALAFFFLETFGINRGYRQKHEIQGAKHDLSVVGRPLSVVSLPGIVWHLDFGMLWAFVI